MSRASPVQKRLLGHILVREGLVTAVQLREALDRQRASDTHLPLGQLLVEDGVITQKQLDMILDRYHKKYRLGDVLVETKTITEEQLDHALDYQRKTGLRLGEVLLHLNLLTESDLRHALCQHLGLTFVDLDSRNVDVTLAGLINESYARYHRVLPISVDPSGITVAMDDPCDLEVVEDVRASTGRRVEVVTTTRAAFDRTFARTYSTDAASTGPAPGLEAEHQELRHAFQRLAQAHDETVRRLAELVAEPADTGQAQRRDGSSLAELQRLLLGPDAGRDTPPHRRDPAALVAAVRRLLDDCDAAVHARDRLLAQYERLREEQTGLRREHERLRQDAEELRDSRQALDQAHAELGRALAGWHARCETLEGERRLALEGLQRALTHLTS